MRSDPATVPTVPAQPATPGQALARLFHETYERLAPEYGYRTREASAKPWEEVPEQNRALMVATCEEVLRIWADELDAAPATATDDALDAVLADLSPEAADLVRRVAQKRDSLARRCALRFEQAERLRAERDMLAKALVHPRRLVDATQLPTAPAVYSLPPEPPPEITELWDRGGCRWDRDTAAGHWRWAGPGQAQPGHWHPDSPEPLVVPWAALVARHGPLSTAPPAGTPGDRG